MRAFGAPRGATARHRDAGDRGRHPAERSRRGTRGGVPLFGGDSRASETRAPKPAQTAEKNVVLGDAASRSDGVARRRRRAGGDSVSESFERRRPAARSVESSRRVLALEAELAETREALGSARFEIDALEAELASTRERAADPRHRSLAVAQAASPVEDLPRRGDGGADAADLRRRAEGEAARACLRRRTTRASASRSWTRWTQNPKDGGDGAW